MGKSFPWELAGIFSNSSAMQKKSVIARRLAEVTAEATKDEMSEEVPSPPDEANLSKSEIASSIAFEKFSSQ